MGRFGNNKSFFSDKGLNSGESVEKFKQGLELIKIYKIKYISKKANMR